MLRHLSLIRLRGIIDFFVCNIEAFYLYFARDGLQLMDGGIVANNPAAIAYHEYLKIWGREIPISLLLSLGTGVPNSTPVPKERGIMDTFEQLVDAALSQDRAHEVCNAWLFCFYFLSRLLF